MTERENWLRLLRNEDPQWITTPWEPFDGNLLDIFSYDPISNECRGVPVTGTYLDQWGVTWKLLENHGFTNPYITDENKAIKDIKKWKEQIIFPPLEGHDWSEAVDYASKVDRNKKLLCSMITGGLFERSHYLMGFQDALCNYMLEPESMFELLGAITEWKLGQLRQIVDRIHPDAVLFHDDWGNKDSLFLPPDVWRRVVKPHQQKIVDFIKSRDIIYLHHSDSYCEPIVEDMAEMGIDGWQGVIPQNDIRAIQDTLQGRMALIGGIDAQIIDMPEADEEIIRTEVRRCIDSYCPKGSFIPCIPNIFPIHPEVKKIYEDELRVYGKEYFLGKILN